LLDLVETGSVVEVEEAVDLRKAGMQRPSEFGPSINRPILRRG